MVFLVSLSHDGGVEDPIRATALIIDTVMAALCVIHGAARECGLHFLKRNLILVLSCHMATILRNYDRLEIR